MRRMIEAAELKNQRTVAPEAHQMHLTPDTDPASTFRLRRCLTAAGCIGQMPLLPFPSHSDSTLTACVLLHAPVRVEPGPAPLLSRIVVLRMARWGGCTSDCT